MNIRRIANALLGLALTLGGASLAWAQTPGQPATSACTTLDRSDVGQYAWGMALRWGTPELLDKLVHQNCIDPNAWQLLGVDQALLIDQVQSATLLAKAVALGWKPVEQEQLDHRRNPFYMNPLISRMLRVQPVDSEAQAMFRQAQARYGFSVVMKDRPSTPTEREDVLIAMAGLMPPSMLNEADPRTGITPLIAAAAAKYDRLVVALLKNGARWQDTYAPMGTRPLRGVWDAAFDGGNCVLKSRLDNDSPLSPVDILDRQDRSIAALHNLWNPGTITSTSTTVKSFALDMVTAQALWLKPADWTILQTGLDKGKVTAATQQAAQIRELQKSQNRHWDYNTLMGSAVPDAVCDTLRLH